LAKETDHINKNVEIVEGSVNTFSQGVESTQVAILRRVNSSLRKLEVRNGKVLPSRENLKILRGLNEDLAKIIVNPAYKKKVKRYLRAFDKLKRHNNSYFNSTLSNFNANKQVFTTIFNASLEATQNSLLQAGINQSVITPVSDIIRQGITSGMFINDMEDALRVEIVGDPTGTITGNPRQGRLLRYTGQITRDSLNQFSRNYVTSVSEEYRMEWFFYDGSIIQDTRDYCKRRAGKYFHRKEVERSATDEWAGKIPGTNRSTIFTYCGGFNCRHEYLPVLIDVVPQSVVRRNLKNGNYEV